MIGLANTNRGVIYLIDSLLQNYGIRTHLTERPPGKTTFKADGSRITSRKPIFNLVIHDKASLKIFAEKIGFTIARKKNKLSEALR